MLMLNITAVLHCSNILTEVGCCRVIKDVKPCCKNNLEVTAERFTGHCGCIMKNAEQPLDIYIDLSVKSSKSSLKNTIDFEQAQINLLSLINKKYSENYSPPYYCASDIYLSNLNLRI